MLNFLDGYKTFLGGLALVVTGLGMVIPSWLEGTFFGSATTEGYSTIGLGVAAWGFGGKLEKLKGTGL